MPIYVKNIAAKFHPDPIWNDAALGLFWRLSPQQQEVQEQQQQDELRDEICSWSKIIYITVAEQSWCAFKIQKKMDNAPHILICMTRKQ